MSTCHLGIDTSNYTTSLAAFADEADAELSGQIAAMKRNGLSRIELRNVGRLSCADLTAEMAKEIRARLRFLDSVGLDYLTLSRRAGSLSGGEAQRIRLATQLGCGLVGVLYILDEPSIGLHQRDNTKLIATLKKLRDIGNTVIVVEHDEETMEESDYIVDIGLRNYLLGYRDGDTGHILENIIYFELLRRGYDVAIGKIDSKEVDFIATKTDEKKYIQVTESMTAPETRKRELAPLEKIADNYEKIVIAMDPGLIQDQAGIKIMSAIDFLLE